MLFDYFKRKHQQNLPDHLNHILKEYQKSRWIDPAFKNKICYAPYTAMNFDQTGNITVCCYNRNKILGHYPGQTIAEAWNNTNRADIMASLEKYDFSCGCDFCLDSIETGAISSALLNYYDEFHKDINKDGSPSVFTFEINNICNLECIMCGGNWSSAIRQNREGIPALKSPYDDAFVKQVRDYIPSLKTMNFLGGEPFLIPLYFHIWEDIAEINKEIRVNITSNGTILNEKAKYVIHNLLNCRISLSIDSLDPKNYEYIRKNASFNILMQNIEWLLEEKKLVSLSVCPMIQNWHDIPDIIRFCENNNLDIYFNYVFQALGENIIGIHTNGIKTFIGNSDDSLFKPRPLPELIPEFSLNNAPVELLNKIVTYYDKFEFDKKYQLQFDHLKNYIRLQMKH